MEGEIEPPAWGGGWGGLEEEYWFPEAAITNDHKLGALKQQKRILSQFWRLEV